MFHEHHVLDVMMIGLLYRTIRHECLVYTLLGPRPYPARGLWLLGAPCPSSCCMHVCAACHLMGQLQSTGHVSDVIGWDAHHSCVPD